MSDRMGALLSPADVARRAGWTCEAGREKECDCKVCRSGARRMRTLLVAQDRELGNMLTKIGSGRNIRYFVTLGGLEAMHPEWFASSKQTAAKVEVLEQDGEDLLAMVRQAHEDIGELRRGQEVLRQHLEELRRKIAARRVA